MSIGSKKILFLASLTLLVAYFGCESSTKTTDDAGEQTVAPPPSGTSGGPSDTPLDSTQKQASAYTVGGNIKGLMGEVVLINNGGDDLKLTQDGGFVFKTPLAANLLYKVAIKTQPAIQTCAVVNESGTVINVNITNVTVTCSTNTYSVSGTASGFKTPITIQNNGKDDITLAADGAFKFLTLLPDATTYEVSVLNHPVGQTCYITNRAGTIKSVNVADVTISCQDKRWQTAVLFTPNTGVAENVYNQATAMDKNGGAVVVWKQGNGQQNQLYYRRYDTSKPSDQRWSAMPNLGKEFLSNNSSSVGDFSLAVNKTTGPTMLVFNQENGSNQSSIYHNIFLPKTGWILQPQLPDFINPQGDANSPVIAIYQGKEAIVAWRQSNGANDMIYFRRCTDIVNNSWDSPPDLANDNLSPLGQDVNRPQLAVMPSGSKAILVWRQKNTQNHELLYYRTYDFATKTWSPMPNLNTDNLTPIGADVGNFTAKMNANENVVVVWEQNDGKNLQIYMRTYDPKTGWLAMPDLATDMFSIAGYEASQFNVALNDNGHAIVAWTQLIGQNNSQIYYREYDPSKGQWSPKPTLGDSLSKAASGIMAASPYVVINDVNDILIVWYNYNTATQKTQGYLTQRVSNAWLQRTAMTPELDVATDFTATASMHDIPENAFAIWKMNDSTHDLLYMSDFR